MNDIFPVNVDRPNSARMYDYYLGGSTNFAVDRDAVHRVLRVLPEATHYMRSNRAFLWRAVRYLVRHAGIDQFLDLGSGIPTVGNVHEVAHEDDPDARVAYVDFDPVAVQHARRLLDDSGEDRVTVTELDIRDPDAVLNAPGVAGLLDFDRPIAVLAVGILPFIQDDDEVRALMARYRDANTADSYAAISHLSALSWTREQLAEALEVLEDTATPERHRDRDEIRALLPGYTFVEPGVVPAPLWRPDQPPTEEEVRTSNCYAGVGHYPGA